MPIPAKTEWAMLPLMKTILLYGDEVEGACQCHAHSFDPHLWLSLSGARVQATTIATALSTLLPDHQVDYINNLQELLKEFRVLEQEVGKALESAKGGMVMMSHPAYGYLCRDYGLKQLSIEVEGKEPTPRQLAQIIEKARRGGVATIYVQRQHSDKGAKAVAAELGVELIVLDPYSADYPSIFREAAAHFANDAFRS